MYWWSYPEWCNGSAYRSSRRRRYVAPATPPCTENAFRESTGHTLALRVAAALLNNPAVTGGAVEVSVHNSVVILDGDIDTEAAKIAAADQVWSVPGVTDVCNALTVTNTQRRPGGLSLT